MIQLKLHTDFSLLRSTIKIKELAKQLKKEGCTAAALTDYNTLAGSIQFLKELKSCGIKPILGCQVSLNSGYTSFLAKNRDGWRLLCNFVNDRRNTLDDFDAQLSITAFSGYLGSDLYCCVFKEHNLLDIQTEDDARRLVRDDWKPLLWDQIKRYRSANIQLYFGLQKNESLPTLSVLNRILLEIALKINVKCFEVGNPHYLTVEDAFLQRILMATRHKCNIDELDNKADADEKQFLVSNSHFLRKIEYSAAAEEIANSVEDYKLLSQPVMAPYSDNDPETFEALLAVGWEKRSSQWQDKIKYADRLREEIKVIKSYEVLITYFLVVWDYCCWARNQGMLIGERGSGAGCLISYLLGITNLDPVEFDLIFSRFFSEARIKDGKVSLPDIDVDFPKYRRESVQEYIINKYGRDRCMRMATFGKFKGKESLKTILRTSSNIGAADMNRITSFIPDEASISDILQEMMNEREHSSAIIWALENVKGIEEFCTCRYNNETKEYHYDGDLASHFKQAIRLENIHRQRGRHASGIILSATPLRDSVEIVAEGDMLIANAEMGDLESIGAPKLDILSSVCLDKIMRAEKYLNIGV